MTLRVLLVEAEPEEALFLKDVLCEIEEGRYFRPWVHLETLHAVTWGDAEAILATETLDVVLLNPDLADSQGFETFRRAQAVAARVPVVLLLGIGDEAMGVRMVREGAQDFLIRKQIDCAPLAHAMRNAVERNRLAAAAQAARFRDPLTGLLNQGCFAMLAERDYRLAREMRAHWMMMLVELCDPEGLVEAYGEQRLDLALVETAELLRGQGSETDLVYRISRFRFAITVFETAKETLEQVAARMARCAPADRVRIGSSIYSPENPLSLEALLEEASAALLGASARTEPWPLPRTLHRSAGLS